MFNIKELTYFFNNFRWNDEAEYDVFQPAWIEESWDTGGGRGGVKLWPRSATKYQVMQNLQLIMLIYIIWHTVLNVDNSMRHLVFSSEQT